MKNISNTPQSYPKVIFDAPSQIKELVDFFQESTVGQSNTQDLGFGFTLPLYYYLRMHKVQCHIRTGIFGKEKLLWIKLVDHPNLIITNSWNQEGEIYIGPLKNEVIISQGCQFNADFAWAFKLWAAALKDQKSLAIHTHSAENQLLYNNIKIASFLNYCQTKLDAENEIASSKIYKRYFEVVDLVVVIYSAIILETFLTILGS
jgi:hypothetical protein